MPALKVLFINLHEEEQVDYLLRSLTTLEYLNGLAVERDALFNDENEEGEADEEQEQNSNQHQDEEEEEQPNSYGNSPNQE